MTYYAVRGDVVKVIGDENAVKKQLPTNTYSVEKDIHGLYLKTIPNFVLPEKIYGVQPKRVERIINTYEQREKSTGVILSGTKGSGKTLLSKNLSIELAKLGISTITVDNAYEDDELNKFLAQIDEPSLIIFDEFEKNYRGESSQEKILTLLDGTIATKKLFVFTCNDSYRLNDHLFNRPGRIYYSYKYKGLDHHFIEDYCNDRLNDQTQTSVIKQLSDMFEEFNFDMLQAIVEECNRYSEPVSEVIKHLNVSPLNGAHSKYEVLSITTNDETVRNITAILPYANYCKPFEEGLHCSVTYEELCDGQWEEANEGISLNPEDIVSFKDKTSLTYKVDDWNIVITQVAKRDFTTLFDL